jgi:hypothetical protein
MSPISFFALHLELHKAGHKIGDGTGFIYIHPESKKKFLVTNYHVLTCRDPKDLARLLPNYPDSPDEIVFYTLSRPSLVPKAGALRIDSATEWLEHSRRSDGVDIVAIPIEFPDQAVVVTQDKLGLVDDIEIEAGSDLFIVGFPWGYGVGDYFPIWKRGVVASEPLFKPNGISMFYIDAFTHPGMSGSPVFAATWRDMIDVDRETYDKFKLVEEGRLSALDLLSTIDQKSIAGGKPRQCFRLVGIYSGRVSVGNRDPNIGIVWQKSLVDELFSAPIIVQHPYPPITTNT